MSPVSGMFPRADRPVSRTLASKWSDRMFVAATTILKTYFSLCLFRSEPRNMPAAGAFCVFSVALYVLSGIALVLVYQPLPHAILSGIIETALLLVLTWILLVAHGLRSRFIQTVTALAGTGFLFSLFSLPLFLLLPREGAGNESPFLAVISLFLLFLVGWNIAVLAHILRHAVSSSFAMGIVLAVGYVWIITAILSFIVPESAA